MARTDLDIHLSKIDALIKEINDIAPADSASYKVVQFRSDLACLLVVAMAATYESCVKNILFDHANNHHAAFGSFASRNFEKLNSRIRISDLMKYCELYDPSIKVKFKNILSKKKSSILNRIGKNIESSYEQILDWRHDFAHAGIRNTTIEEAASTHALAKRVLYLFDKSFTNP